MAWAQYIARRGLIAGHVAETAYVVEFQIVDADPSRITQSSENPSLSGDPSNQYWWGRDALDVRIRSIPLDEATLILEFLKSTEDKQTFTFDPYGWVEKPHSPMQVYRTDAGHSSRRFLRLRQGGHNDRFVFGFSVRER